MKIEKKQIGKPLEDMVVIMGKLLEKANQATSDAALVGACVYVSPGGQSYCWQVTPAQCSAMKGTYVGGPCKK